jgi:hypothetical protein
VRLDERTVTAPVGVTDDRFRAHLRLLAELAALPEGSTGRGWITLMEMIPGHRRYERSQTLLCMDRAANGHLEWRGPFSTPEIHHMPDSEKSLRINIAVPSPARMYDFYLGGKDNYAADRQAARKALSAVPGGRQAARANRRFLIRAVKQLARQGIRQFIDIGAGLPTHPSVHEAARSVAPDAAVLYADNDPMVFVFNRALLGTDDRVVSILADIRSPRDLLARPELRALINFDQPVAVLLGAVLQSRWRRAAT